MKGSVRVIYPPAVGSPHPDPTHISGTIARRTNLLYELLRPLPMAYTWQVLQRFSPEIPLSGGANRDRGVRDQDSGWVKRAGSPIIFKHSKVRRDVIFHLFIRKYQQYFLFTSLMYIRLYKQYYLVCYFWPPSRWIGTAK
jgi:hypothetical protein